MDWIVQHSNVFANDGNVSVDTPDLISHLLAARGIESPEQADAFLTPKMSDLHPPELIPEMIRAADRVVAAIQNNEKIVLFGDYDVDGTTGTAILWHVLTLAGASPQTYTPHRIDEGYGLNCNACRKLADEGAQVIISIDCGVTACEEAALVKDRGIDLIITDHHKAQAERPDAYALVHPGLDGQYPNPHLCGSGVAFKLAWAVAQRLSGETRVAPQFRDLLLELLPLAALATIADVVPLIGENRILTKCGLERMPHTRLRGLKALMQVGRLTNGPVSSVDVAFRLAPRINAAGRMQHAELAVELFTTNHAERAAEIATYLDKHNQERQSTERKVTKEALAMVEQDDLVTDRRRAIVLAGNWHPGVVGIVASRIVDRFHRPVVVISLNGGEGQGSARSISSFDLSSALAECNGSLLNYGGHAMAAGIRISRDEIPSFTEQFIEVANGKLTGRDMVPKLHLDAEVNLDALSMRAAQTLEQFAPFGEGNPEPKFCTGEVELAAEPRIVGKNNEHLQLQVRQNGVTMKGIGFRKAEFADRLKTHRTCRLAFKPIINEFNGRASVELQVIDFKFPDDE
ncbi:MAG: single-stranded-DNA-specific exonuclease RecJ [Phycisphaerae bacterium]